MARPPRHLILHDNCIFHMTWQCHNQDFLLKSDWAKKLYYELILRFKDRYNIEVFSYCFMGNHPHLTGRCRSHEMLSSFLRTVNSLFAKRYNKKYKRRGQVVMDRFKSPVIQTDNDLLKVMQYIDLNPKRAKIVSHPKNYRWSSYSYYAYGEEDPLLTPPEIYLRMGPTPQARQKTYRGMIETILKNDWKEKKPYSSVSFIGNPIWVYQKIEWLREFQKRNRKAEKERLIKNFNLDPP